MRRTSISLSTSANPMELERRAFEVRAGANGTLQGTAVPYGVPSPVDGVFNETFRAGSIAYADAVGVNVDHDQDRMIATLGNGLQLAESPEGLRATVSLPDTEYGRAIRALADANQVRGMSIEFRPIEDEWPAVDERIVTRALLSGLAICHEMQPVHAGALIDEVRARIAAGAPVVLPHRGIHLWA